MAFDLFKLATLAGPSDDDDEKDGDIGGALKYGIRAYLGQNALYRLSDQFFPSQLDQEKLAEQKLRNRLMARQMMLDDDDVDEMAYGPSLSKRFRSGLAQTLVSQSFKHK